MRGITTTHLLSTFTTVGAPLARCGVDEGNLYLWTSDHAAENGHPVYIGASNDAKNRRVTRELQWLRDNDIRNTNLSVISTTLFAHDAEPVKVHWDPAQFDHTKALHALDAARLTDWPADRLREALEDGWAPTEKTMEAVLIRATIHTGTLLGNSQHAGQWETQVGKYTDTLGRLIAVTSGHLDT